MVGSVGITLGVVVGVIIVAGAAFIRRHEARLEEEAERALPGPIQ